MNKLFTLIIISCLTATSIKDAKTKLSDYKLFTEPIYLQNPAHGVVSYSIASPLFSDYAKKMRFMKIPKNSEIKIDFKGVNVLEDETLRQGIKDFSDWPTIPQPYVKGEFIGGCDIVKELFESGELKKKFLEKNLVK